VALFAVCALGIWIGAARVAGAQEATGASSALPGLVASEQTDLDLSSSDAVSEDSASSGAKAQGVSAITVKMLASLALILGLIFLVAYLARRFVPAARRGSGGPDAIRIVSVKSLGPRRSLIFIRVKGRSLLLGSTPNAITRLADLDLPSGADNDERDAMTSFESELTDLTGRHGRE
jgi:flagellar protein FliO/FliZ